MRMRARGVARAALLIAGFVTLGAGTAVPGGAYADTTSGEPESPINPCGTAMVFFGEKEPVCRGLAKIQYLGFPTSNTIRTAIPVNTGNTANKALFACGYAIAIGERVEAACKGGVTLLRGHGGHEPIKPIMLCGVAVAVHGEARARCHGRTKVIFGTGAAIAEKDRTGRRAPKG